MIYCETINSKNVSAPNYPPLAIKHNTMYMIYFIVYERFVLCLLIFETSIFKTLNQISHLTTEKINLKI